MNFILRFFCMILRGLNVIVTPIYSLRARTNKKTIPTIKNELLKISATDLAAKIRKRQLTSEQVCGAYIRRIKEVNPFINAVVEERFESALQDARNVDFYLQTALESNEELEKTKPLLGVPLTVKESCSVAGLSLCGGTLARAGIRADKDGEAVSKLKSKGAIPLLVSNTPEICLSCECTNLVTGTTNNPFDLTRSCGGSSGGEGALLGSGASLIGIGSDVAGSIRLPAMFNGVFGHKPTARLTSIKGHYPNCSDATYANYCVIGPMVRYAKDLKLMMKIMADDASLPVLRLEEKVDLSKIKVFFMEKEGESFVLSSVQNEISLAVSQSVEYLKNKCNCEIVEDFKFVDLKCSCEIAGSTLYALKDTPNLLKSGNQHWAVEILKSLLGLSNYTFNLLYFHLMQYVVNTYISNEGYLLKNEYLKQLFREKLSCDGVFLYPTFVSSAFYHDSSMFKIPSISYTMIVNSLGLPSTHIPCGLDKNGLPIGIQVIAGPNQDILCFAVAQELEKCWGGWIAPS